MMIQDFTNEGENAFSIQALRVQKLKKKGCTREIAKNHFLKNQL